MSEACVYAKILNPFKIKDKSGWEICPKAWKRKWQAVRQAAGRKGTNPWVQDCLRHSYASFHALYYKDFSRLQYEMGHAPSSLLRTRYLNMQGLTQNMANTFWAAA